MRRRRQEACLMDRCRHRKDWQPCMKKWSGENESEMSESDTKGIEQCFTGQ